MMDRDTVDEETYDRVNRLFHGRRLECRTGRADIPVIIAENVLSPEDVGSKPATYESTREWFEEFFECSDEEKIRESAPEPKTSELPQASPLEETRTETPPKEQEQSKRSRKRSKDKGKTQKEDKPKGKSRGRKAKGQPAKEKEAAAPTGEGVPSQGPSDSNKEKQGKGARPQASSK